MASEDTYLTLHGFWSVPHCIQRGNGTKPQSIVVKSVDAKLIVVNSVGSETGGVKVN